MRTTQRSRRLALGRAALACAVTVAALGLTGCYPMLEKRGVAAVNAVRVSEGRRALVPHPQLEARARQVAAGLARQGRLEHSRLGEGLTVRYRYLAENLAHGPTLETAIEALEASPAHRANLVDPRFTHVGVGVATGPGGHVWIAQLFLGA